MQFKSKDEALAIIQAPTFQAVSYDLLDIGMHYGDVSVGLLKEYRAYKYVDNRLQIEKNLGIAYISTQNQAIVLCGIRDNFSYIELKTNIYDFDYVNFIRGYTPSQIIYIVDSVTEFYINALAWT